MTACSQKSYEQLAFPFKIYCDNSNMKQGTLLHRALLTSFLCRQTSVTILTVAEMGPWTGSRASLQIELSKLS